MTSKPEDKRIHRRPEAADDAAWLVRLREAGDDRREQAAFAQWLDEDAANAARIELCELVWDLTADLADDPAFAASEDAGRNAAPVPAPAPLPKRRSRRIAGLVAGLAALAAVLVIGQLLTAGGRVYRTDVGEQHLIRLADGSSVHLNTDSEIKVVYRQEERVVRLLHGEAFFHVAKDRTRPFLVRAGGGTVRALGTQFNVRNRDDAVTVAVIEGRVRVEAPAPAGRTPDGQQDAFRTVLVPGDVASYGPALQVKRQPVAELRRLTSWQVGRIEFEDTPLAEAVAEINRYFDTPIVIDDPRIGKMRVTGVFRTGDLQSAVFAIEKFTGARAVPVDGRIRLVLSGTGG